MVVGYITNVCVLRDSNSNFIDCINDDFTNIKTMEEKEEEIEGEKIAIYGNISEEMFANVNNFTYLCSKYEE